jgi:hypothetical protein
MDDCMYALVTVLVKGKFEVGSGGEKVTSSCKSGDENPGSIKFRKFLTG